MERLMVWAMRHAGPVLALVTAISLLAAVQLPHLKVAISPQSLIIEGDPEQAFYEDTQRTFGSDRITIIYLSDPALFTPEKLEAIRNTVDAIELLPFVARTRSLFNIPDLQVKDEMVSTRPFLATSPQNATEAKALIKRALKNPFVRHNLLSDDGRSMAINVYLRNDVGSEDPGFDERVADELAYAILPLSGILDEAYQIGLPYVHKAITDTVTQEQYKTIGASLAVLAVSLLILFRRLSAVFIPVVTSGLGILWLLGAMAAVSIPLSILTAMVPVLLIIVGSTEDVHLMAECYEGLREGLSLKRAIRRTIRRLSVAIGLTFLTSYLGFLAIGANPIHLVREFGFVASAGLAIRFFLTATLVPSLLAWLTGRKKVAVTRQGTSLHDAFNAAITNFILSYRRLVLLLALVTLGLCLYAASAVQVNNDILSYFDEGSTIKKRVNEQRDRLAGLYTLQVVVDGHIDNTFERVAYLQQLHKIQRFIAKYPNFGGSTSFADYMALLNSAVNDTGEIELPYEDDVAEALMLFVGPDDVKEYLSKDHSKASIVVRHGISNSKDLDRALEDLKQFISKSIDDDLDVTITGESVLTDNAVAYLMKGQLRSLLIILAAIFIVSSLLFVTFKAGMIAVAINLYPVAGLFALMSLAGIPIDSATSMIAALAVGIGVNHTMHFMVRYSINSRGRSDALSAVSKTIRDEARPIGVATVSLAAGFATLAISSFPPIYYFGLLSACTMLFSYAATFVLAPVLLSYVRLNTLWEMLGTNVRYELQNSCALFRDMRINQIRRVILEGRVVTYTDGEVIMQAGDASSEMYVLLDGRVLITSGDPNGKPGAIRIGSVGDVFGVAALTCGRPRVATATSIGTATVMALNWRRLQRLARYFPRSAYLVYRNLSTITGERLASHVDSQTQRLPDRSQQAMGRPMPPR